METKLAREMLVVLEIQKKAVAADRDALVRAVEGMKHKKWNEAIKLTRVEDAHNKALDDVLALLQSPEKK